jgi:hypothetical protein
MSDITLLYLPCQGRIGHLCTRPNPPRREAMSRYDDQIAKPVRTATANSSGMGRAKAVVLEASQTLSGTARDALMAYAMTGRAVASIVIVAAPHLEALLRCFFHGRG